MKKKYSEYPKNAKKNLEIFWDTLSPNKLLESREKYSGIVH